MIGDSQFHLRTIVRTFGTATIKIIIAIVIVTGLVMIFHSNSCRNNLNIVGSGGGIRFLCICCWLMVWRTSVDSNYSRSSSGGAVMVAEAAPFDKEEKEELKVFWDACAFGKLDVVAQMLKEDESLATAVTVDGESCLHLSSVSEDGLPIVKALLNTMEDDDETRKQLINLRVTHKAGLRMTPLSWFTWHNRLPSIEYLFDNYANLIDVNMDFELTPMGPARATATDVSYTLCSMHSEATKNDPLVQTQKSILEILKDNGGQLYEDLFPDDKEHHMSRERSPYQDDEETYGL